LCGQKTKFYSFLFFYFSHIKNEEYLNFLIRLANQGDEMLFSTFDGNINLQMNWKKKKKNNFIYSNLFSFENLKVYESDKDLEDFIDTI
jgi:hypothetical protein